MNGHDGWLGRRERSGDWMVEQAVHVWDVFHWIAGRLADTGHAVGAVATSSPRSTRVAT